MVTQTVLRITTYGDIVAAAAAIPSSAAVDVSPQNTSIKNVSKKLQTQAFNNNQGRANVTQQDSPLAWNNGTKNYKPCGLIQLCCHDGCVNVANFRIGYGFCNLHQAESTAAKQRKNCSQDPQDTAFDDKRIRDASSHHGGLFLSEGSTDNAFSFGGFDSNSGRAGDSSTCDYYVSPEVEKKGVLPSEDLVSEKQVTKHQRCSAFTPFTTVTEPERRRLDKLVIDLSDVPIQSPTPKRGNNSGHGGDSPTGGQTSLELEGEGALSVKNSMGRNEVIKHKRIDTFNTDGRGATKRQKLNEHALGSSQTGDKAESQQRAFPINLRCIPPQPPILKTGCGVSKYEGDFYNREMNRRTAQINLEGTPRYARTVCKDKGRKAIDIVCAQDSFTIDLSDVPPQLPISKRGKRIKEGASQYQGVCFNKKSNKWQARIMIEGKERYIGGYENEEDAAIDYARAVFKYKGQNETLDDCNSKQANSMTGEQGEVTQRPRSNTAAKDVSDLPLRTPIKEGTCQNETLDDCDMKLADPLAGEQSDLEPANNTVTCLGNSKGSISDAKSDGDLHDNKSAHDSKCPSDKIEEKRVLSNDPSEKEGTQQRSGSSQTSAEERSNDSKDKARHPVVPPPKTKTKAGGARVTFPKKLYKMLESVDELGLTHTISWHPDGRSFHVHDVSKFETLTLHQFFEATMFRSIQRQLHLWGFQRDGRGGWCHKYFIRGCPEKLSDIFRTKIKGNGNAFGNKPALTSLISSPGNNFGMYVSAPQASFYVSPETVHALKNTLLRK